MQNEICYLIDSFLEHTDKDNINLKNNLSASIYVREFATLNLRVPRRVGKTRVLDTYSKLYSSPVIVPLLKYRDNYNITPKRNIYSIESLKTKYDSNFFNRMILMDEINIDEFHVNFSMYYTYDTILIGLST